MKRKIFKDVIGQQGMSLIEILIALTLLAIGGGIIGTNVYDRFHEGRTSAAKIQMKNLANSLKDFRRHCNTFPATEQGLDALVTKPAEGKDCPRYAPNGYLDGGKVPVDPWDFPYVYSSDGKTFKITSYGNDNEEGGEGKDADISLDE